MNFATIILYAVSQRVFIVVSVYFVIDSVRKLLVTPLYWSCANQFTVVKCMAVQ
jgi:hypothetical protein